MFDRETIELATYAAIGGFMALLPLGLTFFRTGPVDFPGNGGKISALTGVVLSAIIFLGLLIGPPYNVPYRAVWFSVVWAVLLYLVHAKINARTLCLLLVISFAGVALLLNFSTGTLLERLDRGAVGDFNYDWHHWGAYLSSAMSLEAGLAIYHDFPSQYGLGPSLAILAFKGEVSLAGMFYAVGLMEWLFWCCISYIALMTVYKNSGFNVVAWLLALAATTATCFFWARGDTGFANVTPSLGGARYFPLALMAAVIIHNGKRVWPMHLVWALGALWSMESLFMVSLVWWPVYVLRRFPPEGTLVAKTISLAVSAAHLTSVAFVTLALFLFVYHQIYGVFPDLEIFTAFAQEVPGALPINLVGPFLVVVLSFALAFYTLIKRAQSSGFGSDFYRLFTVLLLSYAAMVYYIGRSADQNILALLPYHALILIELSFGRTSSFCRYAAISLFAALISWKVVGVYGEKVEKFVADFSFDGSELDRRFANHFENPTELDRGRAIAFISQNYGEGITSFDHMGSVVLTGSQVQWNAYNNTTTYLGLRGPVQQKSVHRSKERLMRSGWIMILTNNANINADYVVATFAPDYDIEKTMAFGVYVVHRLVPKR